MVNNMRDLKNKLNNFIKNNRWICVTFILSFIIMCIIYTLQKIAPFGNNSMLDVDFFHQYGPLLNELRDRIVSGENLLYSFNTGGGIPFYRNFLNYLSSPFNIILLFFKKENIVMAYSVIIGLKIVFASTTMSYYLKKVFNKNTFLISIFGILYAFCGYFCAFYWNIMWLDGLVFLPIIMYGINKIINDNKPYTYIISLSVMLFANYFIGYMICIFAVLYFIGCLIIKGNYNVKYILRKTILFFLSSLLAGGICAFALLPLFISLYSISATGGSLPVFTFNFKVLDFIFNHITGVSRTVFASDPLPLPNVYSGLFTLVMLVLLFLNKKINIKIKIVSAICLLVFFFSFNINIIDFMWHAFHVPNDLPYRYSFIYVFCLVAIGYYSAAKLKYVGNIKVSIAFALILLMVFLSSKLNFKNITDDKVLLCSILLLIYYLIYLFIKINKYTNRIGKILLLIVISFEAVFGINSNWDINHDIDTFMSDKKDYQDLIDYVKESDNDLYRIEKTNYKTLNDAAWYDYYGISTFSSMAYESVADFQRKIGLSGNTINSYYYNKYNTPVYNTMFIIRYILGDALESDYYELINSNNTANLMSYKYPSSIAYLADNKLKKWNLISYNPFYNQSEFVRLLTNSKDDIFTPVKVSDVIGGTINDLSFKNSTNSEFNYSVNDPNNEITFVLNNESKDNVYLYVGGSNLSSFYVNDIYYPLTSDEYYIVDIGKYDEDKINVKLKFSSADDSYLYFYAYNLDKDAFNNYYKHINDNKLNVETYNETYINGSINANKKGFVFTTIAYDDGWSVLIDGKKVKTFKIADSYLAFDISKGKHKVELRYYPKGMKTGLIISLLSVILTIFLLPKLNWNKKNIKKDEFSV